MSRDSVLKAKSFEFAVRIINLYKYLKKKQSEYDLSAQNLRSGRSVGALIREVEYAQSRKGFFHKLNIGLKEINETLYWLELLCVTAFITKKMFESMYQDGEEILKMLISSTKTIKERD
jgi:four helix bundle protein